VALEKYTVEFRAAGSAVVIGDVVKQLIFLLKDFELQFLTNSIVPFLVDVELWGRLSHDVRDEFVLVVLLHLRLHVFYQFPGDLQSSFIRRLFLSVRKLEKLIPN